MNVPLPYRWSHYRVHCGFGKRRLQPGKEHYVFDRLLLLAIETGILQREVEQVTGRAAIHGAAGVQGPAKLISRALRRLLVSMGEPPAKHRCLSKRLS